MRHTTIIVLAITVVTMSSTIVVHRQEALVAISVYNEIRMPLYAVYGCITVDVIYIVIFYFMCSIFLVQRYKVLACLVISFNSYRF